MIQTGTQLAVADNSGAKTAKCIKVLGGSQRRYAYVGDVIKISVGHVAANAKVKSGDVMFGLLIRTKYCLPRSNGVNIRFGDNAVVVLTSKKELLGNRIFGPVPKELKQSVAPQVCSLATELV